MGFQGKNADTLMQQEMSIVCNKQSWMLVIFDMNKQGADKNHIYQNKIYCL